MIKSLFNIRMLVILLVLSTPEVGVQAQQEQKFKIRTNASRFPEIQVEIVTGYSLDSIPISLYEEDASIKHQLRKTNEIASSKQYVFILFESSSVTHYKEWTDRAIVPIVQGVSSFMNQHVGEENHHVGYYGLTKPRQKALQLIDKSKYNTEFNRIISESRVKSHKVDLYKAVYEALIWIEDNIDQILDAKLVVVGSGKAISESPIKDRQCVDKARELGVEIHTIGIDSKDRYAFDNFKVLSDNTDGQLYHANNKNDIANKLRDLLVLEEETTIKYLLTFSSTYPKDGSIHLSSLLIGGKSYAISYNTPLSFLNRFRYLLIIATVLVVSLFILMFFFVFRKKKKANPIPVKDESITSFLEKELAANSFIEVKPDTNNFRTDFNQEDAETSVNREKQKNISQVKSEQRWVTAICVPPIEFSILGLPDFVRYDLAEGETSLGRAPENDIVVDNRTVSSKHLVIRYDGKQCVLENLSISNGTYVNQKKIDTAEVSSGDKVIIGEITLLFK